MQKKSKRENKNPWTFCNTRRASTSILITFVQFAFDDLIYWFIIMSKLIASFAAVFLHKVYGSTRATHIPTQTIPTSGNSVPAFALFVAGMEHRRTGITHLGRRLQKQNVTQLHVSRQKTMRL